MATAQHIFNLSMALMDELSMSEGNPTHAETRDYLLRTSKILTVLCNEIYTLSDTWEKAEPGTRPVYAEVTDMNQTLDLDRFITDTVLPYGLAAHLLAEESPRLAAFFLQRYQGLIFSYGGAIPVESEPIRDVYGQRFVN
ncbi:MAG: hypothetical protein FWC90_04855 [Oscillospiraceae bacterium]|nr:hypothetical protein [Oscillospiraceae bacterium]